MARLRAVLQSIPPFRTDWQQGEDLALEAGFINEDTGLPFDPETSVVATRQTPGSAAVSLTVVHLGTGNYRVAVPTPPNGKLIVTVTAVSTTLGQAVASGLFTVMPGV